MSVENIAPSPSGASNREDKSTSAARGSDYADLSRRVRQAGLLDRRHDSYLRIAAFNTGLFAVGVALFFIIGNSWWQLLTAAYFAIAFTQVAFLSHDAGHSQIFRTRRSNDLVGLLHANLVIGLSYGWWVGKHNRHHSHPNQVGADPDITLPVLAFTGDQARSKRGINRFITSHQAYLFFPLLFLEAGQLHVASIKALLQGRVRRGWLEGALLLAHVVIMTTALLLVLSPLRAVAFVLVQQGLLGLYLGLSFAPNHKGMPMLEEGEQMDFLRRQVVTARNVRGGLVVDVLLGGLNYQIEHHLFPSMPRANLRHAQGLVRAFCAEHDLSYCEESLFGSYGDMLRALHATGAPLRRRTLPAAT